MSPVSRNEYVSAQLLSTWSPCAPLVRADVYFPPNVVPTKPPTPTDASCRFSRTCRYTRAKKQSANRGMFDHNVVGICRPNAFAKQDR